MAVYTIERFKPYDTYVDGAGPGGGGLQYRNVKIRVTDPIEWEATITLLKEGWTVTKAKAEAKKQLQEYLIQNAPDETYTVTI